jgi:hypothetical protein
MTLILFVTNKTPQGDSWHTFLLEAKSTLGPQCKWKDWGGGDSSGLKRMTFQIVAENQTTMLGVCALPLHAHFHP